LTGRRKTMLYPDHVTALQLVREHQAELRKLAQPPHREQDTERVRTMAVPSRAPVDRLTPRTWLSWRRRRTLRRAQA
jgi:hypothetical protein